MQRGKWPYKNTCYSDESRAGNLPFLWHSIPRGRAKNRERAPHAHRVIILTLADDQERQKNHCHPTQRQSLGKFQLSRPNNPSPGKDRPGNNHNRPRKPPDQVHPNKLKRRNSVIAPRDIGKRAQMSKPFDSEKLLQKSGEMPFGRDVPRHKQDDKDRNISPMKELAETQTRFAIKKSEQNKNRQRVD